MKIVKRILKWMAVILAGAVGIAILTFFFYCNSLDDVNPIIVSYYQKLKQELQKQGYKSKTLVISGKRARWHNRILTAFGASSKSQHLSGDAIDILVLDVNEDGKINSSDVDIVSQILDKEIIKKKGGLGTYKNENWIWNSQMVHFDTRETMARWHR